MYSPPNDGSAGTKVQTAELTGAALDWAVAVCKNLEIHPPQKDMKIAVRNVEWEPWWVFTPTSNWAQGGPIIERGEIGIKRRSPCMKGEEWEASPSITAKGAGGRWGVGPTPLVAAMRCYVISKMGEAIDLPNELL